ncbi:hypothetical protein TorRG33x02_045820 [Trema orientale]|uniref:Transmembrane protein n=1 Tax=Trema orientale TaxID=63057 RepID=A0A2P5FPS8_TREOI|nr:hypothetical protein TorRG33x02_045820 [Trema orientale]
MLFSRSSSRLVRNFGRKHTLIGCRLSLFGALKANSTKVEEQSFCTSVQAGTPTPEKQPRRVLDCRSIDFWKVDYLNVSLFINYLVLIFPLFFYYLFHYLFSPPLYVFILFNNVNETILPYVG